MPHPPNPYIYVYPVKLVSLFLVWRITLCSCSQRRASYYNCNYFFFISKHVTYAGMLELCKLEGRPAVCYYFLILAMASPGLVNVATVYMQCADMHALISPPPLEPTKRGRGYSYSMKL